MALNREEDESQTLWHFPPEQRPVKHGKTRSYLPGTVLSKYSKILIFIFLIGVTSSVYFYTKLLTATFPTKASELQNYFLESENPAAPDFFTSPSPNPEDPIACHLPKLHPFDPAILRYYKLEKYVPCSDSYHPLIFTAEGNLIKTLNAPSLLNFTNCEYCPAVYAKNSIKLQVLYKFCVPIKTSTVKVPSKYEFAVTRCKQGGKPKTIRGFHFINPKPEITKRVAAYNNAQTEKAKLEKTQPTSPPPPEDKPLNVVILGIDAVSHMNFHRVMPKTLNYLTQNLSAYSMWGVTKVGDNTFPNLVPVLTGLFDRELSKVCVKNFRVNYFDPCPFIWKRFAAKGYRTAYGEDASRLATFNYFKKGFQKPPTDYFFTPLAAIYDNLKLNHRDRGNAQICYAAQTGFELMLDFVKNMALQMNRTNPYFQLVWSSSLTHDNLNDGAMGDEALLHTLQFLYQQNYLNNTALILMSDHGIRWGGIRSTLQGRLEERMPFLYFILPEWFRQKYRPAITNMLSNKNKLTTPFDLHETLKDLLDVHSIRKDTLLERESQLLGRTKNNTMPRGISLFLPIPSQRLCKDARIPVHWCVCRALTAIKVDNNLVKEAARTAVHYINGMFISFPQCLPLTLAKVLSAQVLQSSNNGLKDAAKAVIEQSHKKINSQPVTLSITFQVNPSQALFETTMTRGDGRKWSPPQEISRTNLYGEQSRCVSDFELKKFCYCG